MATDEEVQKLAGAVLKVDVGLGGISTGPAPWTACTVEVKLDRLRRVLRDLRWTLDQARRHAAQFESHEHNAKGEVVVPLHLRGGQGEGASSYDTLA